jgi:hypothetical protein
MDSQCSRSLAQTHRRAPNGPGEVLQLRADFERILLKYRRYDGVARRLRALDKLLTLMKKRGECLSSTIASRRQVHEEMKVVEWPLWRCRKHVNLFLVIEQP